MRLLALSLFVAAPAAEAKVWHVSHGDPFGQASIQEAVDLAAAGDTIDIATGMYPEHVSIVNKTLLLRGSGIDQTIVTGSSQFGHVFALRGGSNSTEIRDLTIRDGVANSPGDPLGGIEGGNVLGEEAFFALVRCRLDHGTSGGLGGNLYATAQPFNGTPTGGPPPLRDHVLLEDCVIENGFGGSEGGGLCFDHAYFRITGCTIRNNFSGQGGGVSLITSVGEMALCLVDNNEAILDGGGLRLDAILGPSTTMQIERCTFVRNRASRYGSAVAIMSGESIVVENNLFDGNGPANSVLGCANAAVYAGGCNHFGTNSAPPVDGCPPIATDTTGNPLFCDPDAGDWRLCISSPAYLAHGTCSIRGAFGVGCEGALCQTAVQPTTWSGLKLLLR